MTNDRLRTITENIRARRPLIHLLTNSVVENFSANALLALGASPICTRDLSDTKECALKSDAILINIGTFDESFLACTREVQEVVRRKPKPVVLDPVGCGFTRARRMAAFGILEALNVTLIKGNYSEISALSLGDLRQHGVESIRTDINHGVIIDLNQKFNCAVIATGKIDLICYNNTIAESSHGHELMQQVIGMGCVLGAIAAACLSVTDDILLAAQAAAAINGIAGERAANMSVLPGSFANNFIDGLHDLHQYLAEK